MNKVEGIQNVSISKSIPPELSKQEQLLVMEEYTKTHQKYLGEDKAVRELACLRVLFPKLFRHDEPQDLISGRLDFLPIGFGSVTSIGGVGHYCVFHKLIEFQEGLEDFEKARVDKLYNYWLKHDTKAIFCETQVNESTVGRFIDGRYPLMATARLSGLMLDYNKLMNNGIEGLKNLTVKSNNSFMKSSYDALVLFQEVVETQIKKLEAELVLVDGQRKKDVQRMVESLNHIKIKPPETFHQALQLFWLYALVAGVINYGRMDEVLGTFLKNDIKNGVLDEKEALRLIESLWMLIENRRTTVNGRIIVGGKGRKDVEGADLFTRLCLKVALKLRTVEPQFTLRFDKDTPSDIMDMAYECLAAGATYPTLYNDDVNIPAVQYGMRVEESIAQQYVPFGCGEFVIQGKSIGTPNILINLVKIMQLALNEGKDPMDGINKSGNVKVNPITSFDTFDKFVDQYKELLDYYFDLSVENQLYSYQVMNQEASFLFSSILMDDCLGREKAVLDGGIEILGGTNETYGNINASDALYAIKKLVYDDKKYSLEELNEAALQNFEHNPTLRDDLWNVDKYGNDLDEVDDMADKLYQYVAKGIRNRGVQAGMDYFLIVISNNQTNTDWGKLTHASLDGRYKGQYMNPANNPQGGAAISGPTAVLNSLRKFNPKYHGGSVQNIRMTPKMMKQDKEKVKAMMEVYFEQGGCQLMVTVVNHEDLIDAQKYPEKYPDLIVRVAGYSARFVDLDKDIQDELLSRASHG